MSILIKNVPRVHIAPNGTVPVEIPPTAFSFEGFRAWTHQEDFPAKGKIEYVDGEIWIDMSPERINSHILVKEVISYTLGHLNRKKRFGKVLLDGTRIVNEGVELSNEPDLVFISKKSLRSGKVRKVPTADGEDTIEFEGAPDMVLEVLSPSSRRKDEKLEQSYYDAGIAEYWRANCLRTSVNLKLLTRGRSKFVAARAQGGWLYSKVFKHWFHLARLADEFGLAEYVLEVKSSRPKTK